VVHRWCGVVHSRSSWSVVGSIVVGVVLSTVVVLRICGRGDARGTTDRILFWFDSELVSMKIALLNIVRKGLRQVYRKACTYFSKRSTIGFVTGCVFDKGKDVGGAICCRNSQK
jgi:hypothetical protein